MLLIFRDTLCVSAPTLYSENKPVQKSKCSDEIQWEKIDHSGYSKCLWLQRNSLWLSLHLDIM